MTKPELLKYLGNFLTEELNRGQLHDDSSDEWQTSDNKNPYWDAYLLSRSWELVNQMQKERQ